MSELAKKTVITQVKVEIEQIDQLFSVYADLLQQTQEHAPDLIEITAIASILHSFYNGLENIFLSIAKGLDEKSPAGSRWHRDLLVQMTKQTEKRNSVISAEMSQRLVDYLAFRHFYQHSYSFFLEWDELKKLVTSIQKFWNDMKKEIYEFLTELESPENHEQNSTKKQMKNIERSTG